MHPITQQAFFSELEKISVVSEFAEEIGNVGQGERAALKYSALDVPPEVKNPDKQSPYGRQLLMGQEVEKEHKDTIGWLKKNPDAPLETATRSIASDHLDEDRAYYSHLKEMEDKYKKTAAVMRKRLR